MVLIFGCSVYKLKQFWIYITKNSSSDLIIISYSVVFTVLKTRDYFYVEGLAAYFVHFAVPSETIVNISILQTFYFQPKIINHW